MSKVLFAECDGSEKIFVDGLEVPDAVILSEGKQASDGILVIEGELVKYLTSSAADLKTALEKMAVGLDKVKASIDLLSTGLTGATSAAPPTLAVSLAEIDSVKTELEQLSGALK